MLMCAFFSALLFFAVSAFSRSLMYENLTSSRSHLMSFSSRTHHKTMASRCGEKEPSRGFLGKLSSDRNRVESPFHSVPTHIWADISFELRDQADGGRARPIRWHILVHCGSLRVEMSVRVRIILFIVQYLFNRLTRFRDECSCPFC